MAGPLSLSRQQSVQPGAAVASSESSHGLGPDRLEVVGFQNPGVA